MSSRWIRRAPHFIGLTVAILFSLFPVYWMVLGSFKNQVDLLANPPVWFFSPTLNNYYEALSDPKVINGTINSLIVASATTILAIALGAPAAYALALFEFKGKSDLWFWFITNRMISPIVLALPVYIVAQQLGLLDTHIVLILIYITFNLPIVVWICTDQFRSIPADLAQAARLEGANHFDVFWRIYLPLGLPGIAVSGIFSFIFSWNELLYALVLTRRNVQTAPVAATSYMSGYEFPWGKIMATGTIIILPVTVFALLVSRHMVRGLTMGATK